MPRVKNGNNGSTSGSSSKNERAERQEPFNNLPQVAARLGKSETRIRALVTSGIEVAPHDSKPASTFVLQTRVVHPFAEYPHIAFREITAESVAEYERLDKAGLLGGKASNATIYNVWLPNDDAITTQILELLQANGVKYRMQPPRKKAVNADGTVNDDDDDGDDDE